jgi:acetate kinase
VRYVSTRAIEFLKRPAEEVKMVVFHLGNGVTVTAVANAKVVDTSIGFATFSGVMMGTRSGDIDPGLIFHLHRHLGLTPDQIEHMIYRESGLLGVSGVSNDMRVVTEQALKGNARCRLALEIYAYMAKKYLGAFAAAMGGLNCVVFTAGIGENSAIIRSMICENMDFFGIKIVPSLNGKAVGGKEEVCISTPDSSTAVLVIPTDEEKMIALDTMKLANLGKQ